MSLLKISDVSVVIAHLEIMRNYHLFGEEPRREQFDGSPHCHTQAIYLRVPPGLFDTEDLAELKDGFQNSIEAEDTDLYTLFPEVRKMVTGLACKVSAERIGRVVIVKLAAGMDIAGHIDEGDMPEYYDRFHIVISSSQVTFKCGNTLATMLPGEAWWIDNQEWHSVTNAGAIDRIHIIVDLRFQE